MLRPALLLATALSILGLAAVGGAATAASNCDKKGKEGMWCTLPNRTSYQVTKGENDEFNISKHRGKAQLDFRSSCANQRRGRYKIKGPLKVGVSYDFDKVTKVPTERVVVTYTVRLTAKIVSAKKAVVKGTVNAYQPAIPPSGSESGEDELRLDCKVNRTLKRVLGD